MTYFVAEDKNKLLSWVYCATKTGVFFPRSRGKLILFLFKNKLANISVLRQTWNFQIIPQTNSSRVYKKVNDEMEVILITQPVTIILWQTEQTWSLQNTTGLI